MIDAQKVERIFLDCLFKEGEIDEKGNPKIDPIKVEGIVGNFGFHPGRIEEHKNEIISFLKELPDEFHKNKGGGWSFLNACRTKEGKEWTSLHQRMEQLFCLGIAISKVKYLMPKEMWTAFPGGMPYIIVDI